MMWGDQWRCHCGTHNLFLRERCRDCDEPRPNDAPTETAEQVMTRVEAANAEGVDGRAEPGQDGGDGTL